MSSMKPNTEIPQNENYDTTVNQVSLGEEVTSPPTRDLSSIYPTPTEGTAYKANNPQAGLGAIQGMIPTGSHTAAALAQVPKKRRASVTAFGYFMIFSPLFWFALSLLTMVVSSTNPDAKGWALILTLIMIINPFTLLAFVVSLLLGIGIIKRINFARIVTIIVICLSLASSLYTFATYTLKLGSLDSRVAAQSFPAEMNQGASGAQERDMTSRQTSENQAIQGVGGSDSGSQTKISPPNISISPLAVVLQMLSVVLHIGILIFLTRTDVKKEFH
jgi:hypothetical protein